MSREKADEMLKSASPAIIEYIEAIASDQENQDDGKSSCVIRSLSVHLFVMIPVRACISSQQPAI